MNFKKLQAMQAQLDEKISGEKPNMSAEERFNKTLCDLSVAVARLFDCHKNRKVNTERFKSQLNQDGTIHDYKNVATGEFLLVKQAYHLTLVEETAEAWHFILSLANQLKMGIETNLGGIDISEPSKISLYLELQKTVSDLKNTLYSFDLLVADYLIYVQRLGITLEELEQAYYEKQKINYERLESGY